jgi:hypothetical protein
MPLQKFSPFRIEEFFGLNTLYNQQDLPAQYSPGPCRNVTFTKGGFDTRDGTITEFDLTGGTDIFHSEFLTIPQPFQKVYLFLMEDRKLYYSTGGARALLLDNPPLTSTTSHFKVSLFGNFGVLTFSDGFAGTTAPYITRQSKATGTLSGTANPANNDTVTIDGVVYTFKTTLTASPVANEILIETAATLSLGNLAKALSGEDGQGVKYSFGTVAHPTVRWKYLFYDTATPASSLVVEAVYPGTAGNSITTTESSAVLSWGGATLSGGGTISARLASIAPVGIGTLAAVDGGAASPGITAGVHKIRVVYETDSGYRTRPSADFLEFTAAGSQSVDVTSIPVHPDASVVRRHLVMTEASLDTYYILATIDNNTFTSIPDINVSDAELRTSTEVTDYFQYQSPLPGAIGSLVFHNRLITWGDGSNSSLLRISEPGQPETFREDIGLLEVRRDDGQRITNAFVIRDVLYCVKERSLHAINDNGEGPSSWPVVLVSDDCGSQSPSGVSHLSDEDFAIIQDIKGLYLFTGLQPRKLSQGIQPTWDTRNYDAMQTAEVHIDTAHRRILSLMPTGAATQPNITLVCDYEKGWEQPRWATWETDGAEWRSFIIDGADIVISAASALVRTFTMNLVAASGTLTASANPAAGSTVTIDGTTYTYRAALTAPAVANEILIGAAAADSLHNLAAAINRWDGRGSLYSLFTNRHSSVTAAHTDGASTMAVSARVWGTVGNALATTEVSSQLSWGGATLSGGTDNTDNGTAIDMAMRTGNVEGTTYGDNYYGRLVASVRGAGDLTLKIYGPDGTLLTAPAGFELTNDPERDFVRSLNVQKSRVFLEFSQNATGSYASVSRVTPMIAPVGLSEPESASA